VLSLPRAVTPAKVDSTHREAGKDGPARSLVFAKLVQLNGGPSGRNWCWVTHRPLTLVSQSAAASTSCPSGAEISASAFWGNAHGRRRHNARMRTPPTLPSVIGPTIRGNESVGGRCSRRSASARSSSDRDGRRARFRGGRSAGAQRRDGSIRAQQRRRRMPATDLSAGRKCGDTPRAVLCPRYPALQSTLRTAQTQRSVQHVTRCDHD